MLNEYVEEYAKAWLSNDEAEMQRIETDMRTLGMDKLTLRVLAKEVIDRWKRNQQTES